MQQMTAWGSDENGLEFTDRGRTDADRILGAAHEVTGSCHYVTFGDKHVLVDCGMEQDRICM